MQPTRFEIPEQIRQAAESSVKQARDAFEQVLDATQKAVAGVGGSAWSLGEGAADLQRQSLAYLEENIAASFDLAQRLVQARTLEEVAALQQEYLRRQMTALAEQGKALGAMATKAATETPRKKK
ncbi:MAG TPA: phasin family protein [Bauldia sp.]|nr:phasin family protein [Bauldia sp.]